MSDKRILHGSKLSGHVHRVELMLRILELDYEFRDVKGPDRKTPEFLRMNPLGQVPVLEDGDTILNDSNAILVYLVKRYAPTGPWLPDEPVAAAKVQCWLSIAAGELMYGPCTARLIVLFGKAADRTRAIEISNGLLGHMDAHLRGRDFLAARHATLADIACYAYVAHAPEGGVPLTPYPAVRDWLKRVEGLDHFKSMQASATAA